jgi:hypothetical protein
MLSAFKVCYGVTASGARRSFVRFIARENLARGSEADRAYSGFERTSI